MTSALIASVAAAFAFSQEQRLVREMVHSKSLENTVTEESADRSVTVYLPPSYDKCPEKRYPVIYLLHGIGDTDETWLNGKEDWMNIMSVMDNGIAENRFGEMIIIMPDEKTNWHGSFYTNSVVTGNWEDFTTKELVIYIDTKYRTLARPESRGIAGHSMGGYGAIKMGLKHPEVFSVVYGMNAAALAWGRDLSIENPAFEILLRVKSFDEAWKTQDIYVIGGITLAQAFSPNPEKPPFFADFPFEMVEGKLRPAEPAFGKWEENFPVNMVRKYRSNIQKLRGFRFDSGYEDEYTHIPVANRKLSAELTSLGLEHIFEEYNGDHRNRMWGRNGRLCTEMLPYFWSLLKHQNS